MSAQVDVQYYPIHSVSAGTGGGEYDNVRPRIALTRNDVPLVLWAHANDENYYTARWNGSGFDQPVAVLPVGFHGIAINSEGPEIAAFGDTVFVSFTSLPYGSGKPYIVKSTDGGQSWGDTVRVAPMTSGMALFAYVAVDSIGNPIVSFMMNDPGWANPRYLIARSTDGGQSFLPPQDASIVSPEDVCECCPSSIAVSDSVVAVMFRNNDANLREIHVGVSTNNADTFLTEIDIDSSGWFINSCPATGPEGYIRGDSLHVTWMSRGSGLARTWYGTASLSTGQVGMSRMLNSNVINSTLQNYPQIAGRRDTIGVVWQQAYGDVDAYLAWSVNGSGPLFSNIDKFTYPDVGSQRNPDVAFSNGTFHLVYQDDASNEVIYRYGKVVLGTAVPEMDVNADWRVYPNPVDDRLRVSGSGIRNAAEWRIVDVMGSVLLTGGGLGDIDVRNLDSGGYFLEVLWDDGERVVLRFLKD